MAKKDKRFNTNINGKDFKIIVQKDGRYVMAVPQPPTYPPSGLHIILNGKYHHYDIYNEKGEKDDKIYLHGFDERQNFYVTSGNRHYKIDVEADVKLLPIDEIPQLEYETSGNTLIVKSSADGWIVAISNKPFVEE